MYTPTGLIKRAITHPMLRHNGYFLISTVVTGLGSYLINTTAARRFAPGDYSQFGIALNLLAFCIPFSSAIAGATLRQASFNRSRGREIETDAVQRALVYRLTLACGIGLCVVGLTHAAIGQFLRLTMTVPLFLTVVIGYALTVQASLAAIWQEQGRYGRISAIFVTEGVFRAVFGIAAILFGASMVVVLLIYAISSVFLVFLFPRPSALWTGARASGVAMRAVYRDIGRLAFASFLLIVLTNFDVLLCRRSLDPATADRYVAIAALAKFFLFATTSVSTIAFVETVKDEHRADTGVRSLMISGALIAALGALFIGFCALFGPFVTGLAFGTSFRASGSALWIAATGALAMSLVNLVVAYANARRRLWYLPILVLGGIVTVSALSLTRNSLHAYAGAYTAGTGAIAVALVAMVTMAQGKSRWNPMHAVSDG